MDSDLKKKKNIVQRHHPQPPHVQWNMQMTPAQFASSDSRSHDYYKKLWGDFRSL